MWLKIATIGLVLRLLLIFYVSDQDNYYEGIFTKIVDVDYKVYLDSSLYQSPYLRHTYRYSPLLSWLVAPSYHLHQLFGKVLIALFDFAAIAFVYKIFQNRPTEKKQANQKAAKIISYVYALNPVMIYVTVRGSCEGITMALASAFWYFYFGGDVHGNMSPVERVDKGYGERQPNTLKKYISYAIFGLWVHFRVYPIVLVPLLIMHQYHSAKEDKLKKTINFVLEFGLVSGGVFLGLAAFCYYLYGYDFLHETYFYHLTRRDNRHSKSVYFYELYLNFKNDTLGKYAQRFVNRLLPTIIAILTVSFVFVKKRSLFYCQGLITCYLVIFNRVITDQYYVWVYMGMYFGIPELVAFREKKWSMVVTRLIKDIFLTPLPVLLWLLMTLKLQNNVGDVRLHHVWFCSLFILVIHGILITKFFNDMKPYSKEYEQKLRIEQAKSLLTGRGKDD